MWTRTRNLSVPESTGMRYLADWLEHAKEPHHDEYDHEVTRKSRLHRTGLPAQIYVRSPSLRSTTATASDSHGDFSSNTDEYSSGSSGVHLTNFNVQCLPSCCLGTCRSTGNQTATLDSTLPYTPKATSSFLLKYIRSLMLLPPPLFGTFVSLSLL